MPADPNNASTVDVAALVIGVESYSRSDLDSMEGAAGDAESFAQAIQSFWPTALITQLTDNPTLREINSGLHALRQQPANLTLFYFSGHGVATETDSYLCTSDSEDGNEGLPLSMLIRQLGRNDSPSQWLALLDCCHAAPKQMRNAYIARSDIENAMTGLGVSRAVLAACGPASESVMTGDGRSPFTDAVIAGLDGAASNPDGNVTLSSLYDFVTTLSEQGLPEPVLISDLSDGFVLRSGLESRGSRGLSRRSIDTICEEADRLVSSLRIHMSANDATWRRSAWADACRAIRPIERWLAGKAKSQPELLQDKRFRSACEALDRDVATVATVSEGIRTSHGVVGQQIGKGGFGTVWTLHGLTRNDPTRALKVYHATEVQDRAKRTRFEHGYRAMEQLSHPGIAKVEMYIETPPAILMEWIAGPNLRKFNDFPNMLSRLQFLAGICEALLYAHNHEVYHRDIKPENILVSMDRSGPRPIITDFDLASYTTATAVTKKGMGHVPYTSPEQLRGPAAGELRTPLSDVYSVGQLLYFLVIGSDPHPYDESDNLERLRVQISGKGSDLSFAATRLANFYSAAASSDPRNRESSMATLLDSLNLIIHCQDTAEGDIPLTFRTFINHTLSRARMKISIGGSFYQVHASSETGRTDLDFTKNPLRTPATRNDIRVHFRTWGASRRPRQRGLVQARADNRSRIDAMVAADKDVHPRAINNGFLMGELYCEFTEYNFELAREFGRRLQHIVAAADR
jgi:eukaryotic-like serine/threonine-protein kinase